MIVDNLAAFNGARENSPWASQILISGSLDTLVWHNRVEVAASYGHGIYVIQEERSNDSNVISELPRYDSRGDVVMGNTITFLGSAGVSGFYDSKADATALLPVNRFEDNEIVAPEGDTRRFKVGNKTLDSAQAQQQGQELGSQVIAKSSTDLQNLPPPACPAGVGPHSLDHP
jgi:hypothetical protein